METQKADYSSNQSKIEVMLVDDSAVIRGLLARALETDPHIHVISSVANGEMAVQGVVRANPDIVILDIEMPVMDGLTALPLILEKDPHVKVLVCSTLSEKGADVSLKAMALGAADCILKPSSTGELGTNAAGDFQKNLVQLVKALGKKEGRPAEDRASRTSADIAAHLANIAKPGAPKPPTVVQLHDDRFSYRGKPDIVAIGSSTGGPQALFEVLKNLRDIKVPVVITQHMPKTFTSLLADHINQNCKIPCFEGEEGMKVEPGNAYVAPGGLHMTFKKRGLDTVITLSDGEPENFCKPSVEPMMRSLVELYGDKILGVMLTGMGNDGRDSFKKLVERGGRVIAQDEKTSTVWGMPGAVAKEGICSAILPLTDIGPWINKAMVQAV